MASRTTLAGNIKPTVALDRNDQLRADALERKILRQHKWRTQVAAECELRIREMQEQRNALGDVEPIDIEVFEFRTLTEEGLRALTSAGSDD